MLIKEIATLLRPHQYIKNVFVLAPIFFSGLATDIHLLVQSLYAFIFFSLTASSIYIFNDIMDVEEDKAHPNKKNRPIARGSVPISTAWIASIVLMAMSLLGSLYVSVNLTYILVAYILLNFFYSIGFKHISILDISMISTGFVLRLFSGSVVIKTLPSMWIILMTFLLALFLAFAKRRDDVLLSSGGLQVRKNVDGYSLEFVNSGMVIMASVVIVAYIFYTISESVEIRLGTNYLYLTVFFVIIGVLRYLQITFVENNSGSPTRIILSDKFLQLSLVLWALSLGFIIYGSKIA
jgi:decaprenyl-phosphate phosphoribosyltransferase